MRFGKLEIDPAVNPAVLDTATWGVERVRRVLDFAGEDHWQTVRRAVAAGGAAPAHAECTVYPGSWALRGGNACSLVRLSDGQHVFVEIGTGDGALANPLYVMPLDSRVRLTAYAADRAGTRAYLRTVRPDKAPRALGAVRRLGIGTRMSTSVWPGIWRAMDEGQFAANAIQNSVRELNLLEDVLTGRPARKNYLYGFGTLAEGHTGSTFEGLWVAGALEALKAETQPVYGADADHITVRRGPDGLERAKRIIDAARDYTFFTLDVSDIVDYTAQACPSNILAGGGDPEGRGPAASGGQSNAAEDGGGTRLEPEPGRPQAGYLDCKYGAALEAVTQLAAYVKHVKGDAPFDLELSIDECPPQMPAPACLTTEPELVFLIDELRQRGVAVTHVAPNVGVVKGQDYAGADDLAGFEQRIRGLQAVAAERGIMLDFHSGDDLRSAVRRAIGRATGGRNHFKVSPSLQVIFAEVLHEVCPERFGFWWEDTLAYARQEASAGSDFAAQCLREYQTGPDPSPAPHHSVFHHYSFASVGRRDENGQFVHRDKFYRLPPEFYRAYEDRIQRFLCAVAADVFAA